MMTERHFIWTRHRSGLAYQVEFPSKHAAIRALHIYRPLTSDCVCYSVRAA